MASVFRDCSAVSCTAGTFFSADALCPANTVVLGGGGFAADSNTGLFDPNFVLVLSEPNAIDDGWQVDGIFTADKSGGDHYWVEAQVVCST
jgi:hypothetical protein